MIPKDDPKVCKYPVSTTSLFINWWKGLRCNAKRPAPDGFRSHTPQASVRMPIATFSHFTSAFGEQQQHIPLDRPMSSMRPTTRSRLRTLGRPTFAGLPQLNADFSQSSKKRVITSYQIVNSPQPDILGKPLPLLQHPPSIPVAASRKTGPLKVQPPPALLVPVSEPQVKGLKTISTTRVARSTDPSTAGGNTELLSIFLQEEGHNLLASDREPERGILLSPEKVGKGKSPKFIRYAVISVSLRHLSISHTGVALLNEHVKFCPDLTLFYPSGN